MLYRGKFANVKVGGTPIAATGLATTDAGDHKTYTLTDPTRAVLTRTGAVTVYVNGTPTGAAYTLDRLFGRIVFAVALLGTDVVTVDASYTPMTSIAEAHDYAINVTGMDADKTTFASAGWTERSMVRHDAAGTISRFYQADSLFTDLLTNASVVVVEHWRDAATVDSRAWAIFDKDDVKASVGSLVDETYSWLGAADADGRSVSFA